MSDSNLRASAPTASRATVAGVELGGTKVVVAVGDGPATRIPTQSPEITLAETISILRREQAEGRRFSAIGVASFGPVDINPASPRYGRLLNTPKAGWVGADLLEPLRQAFGVPLVLETDVNAAAVAEGLHAARGCDSYAYITVGTGVGVGLIVAGRPVHGAGHPEAGHVLIRQRPDDHFPGICFAHGACAEGLFSGPALQARLGEPLDPLGADHPIWDRAGDYLAQLCMSLVLVTAPQRIVIGGGVGARPELLQAARNHLFRHLNRYLDRYPTPREIETLLVPATLEHSGLKGAMLLAEAAIGPATSDVARPS